MCALFYAFESLIEHWSAKKRINLRRTTKLLSLLGLAGNAIAVTALSVFHNQSHWPK
jgi:hypothetical protein